MSNQGEPVISVVIPTYNHANFLKSCLKSILAQSYSAWEAIVVNNYSQDETVGVVNAFGDARIRLVNFRNSGVIAASRNEGIRQARGSFIAFLDSDDWWYPDKLAAVVKLADSADVIFHDLDILAQRRENGRRKASGRQLLRPVLVDLLRRENALPNSSVVVRKTIIASVGGLSEDPELISAEDFDLWLRVAQVTERFVYIPRSLGVYRAAYAANMSGAIDRHIRSIESVYAKFLPFLSGFDRRQSEKSMHYCLARIMLNKHLYDGALPHLAKCLGIQDVRINVKALIFMALAYRNKIMRRFKIKE